MKAGQGFNATSEQQRDIFPRDDNGIPLNTFLVTVKNKEEPSGNTRDASSEVSRFMIFASTSAKAHEMAVDYMTRNNIKESWLRITVESAQIVSGGGIVLL